MSWGIAFFEYLLMVPANRMGSEVYSVVQLKTIQEILTLVVFAGFSVWFLGQPLKWNHYAAFALIIGAAFLMFYEPGSAAVACSSCGGLEPALCSMFFRRRMGSGRLTGKMRYTNNWYTGGDHGQEHQYQLRRSL